MKTIISFLGVFFTIQQSMAALPKYLIEVNASDKYQRTAISNMGLAIEETLSDKVFLYGNDSDANKLRKSGFTVSTHAFQKSWVENKGRADNFHDYPQVVSEMQALANANPDFVSYSVFGKSLEGRDLPLLRISSRTVAEATAEKIPTIFYMGCHHAREHLSVEVPIKYAAYLVNQAKTDPYFRDLLAKREVFIAPMINPDGHIYDRSKSGFRMWRKNRRFVRTGVFGVDLNRNYGHKWGTGGSSTNPTSDVYMGPSPFSEPETQAVRDFVLSQRRMTVLLSFHTFSELVLYPWGHKYDPIEKPLDRQIFQKMATDMSKWNGYKPQQSSELYIASGDTTDWSYGELGIFSFTFELSPKSMWDGGFYPGDGAIQPTYNANLKPMTYLIEYADRPERVLTEKIPDFKSTPSSKGFSIADPNDLDF